MPSHSRCTVTVCNNDKRYPDKIVKHNNVEGNLIMHKLPTCKERRNAWIHHVSTGIKDFVVRKNFFVCSNHFLEGKPTKDNPDPTLFLKISTNTIITPKKRKVPFPRNSIINSKKVLVMKETKSNLTDGCCSSSVDCGDSELNFVVADEREIATSSEFLFSVPMMFCQLTRANDVQFFTGLVSTEFFKSVFNHLKHKASVMTYWDGSNKSLKLIKRSSSVELTEAILLSPDYDVDPSLFELHKTGPKRKLSLEQELLLVIMKLRLGLMVEDLSFRFQVSPGKVSQIFLTWIKLMSKELSVLIIWPSSMKIKATLPKCFIRLFPNVCTIIDCTEVFMETPSSLSVQACLYSSYKHHCTVKCLVAITPNGALSWISPVYGGRASDVLIVCDSGFLDMLEPKDQVMADRGFKIKTDLAMKQCTLCIPPSAAKGNQMTVKDVRNTSNIANVRIYVEQAIKRMKEFHILKRQQPILLLPVFNEIVVVIASLVNLKKPLVK